MNVVSSTRTEVDYTFKMSQADLDRYMADPWLWRDEVQAQLKLSGVVASMGGDGAAPAKRAKSGPRSQITFGRSTKKAAAKNGRARRGRPATASGLPRENCLICGELITSKFMNLHMKKKHSGHSAPSGNGLHPEAVPAAG